MVIGVTNNPKKSTSTRADKSPKAYLNVYHLQKFILKMREVTFISILVYKYYKKERVNPI